MRYKLRENRILKIAKRNERQVVFPDVSKILKVGVIADGSLHSDLVNAYFDHAEEIEFLEVRNSVRPKGDDSQLIYVSDLNFLGIPPQRLIGAFVGKPFDILVNFASSSNDVINFICASSQARMKVSKYRWNDVYDLIIHQPEIDDVNYLKEIIRTLNNFSN